MIDYILKPLIKFLTKPIISLLLNLAELLNDTYERLKRKK
jgi:hypothetical protein